MQGPLEWVALRSAGHRTLIYGPFTTGPLASGILSTGPPAAGCALEVDRQTAYQTQARCKGLSQIKVL